MEFYKVYAIIPQRVKHMCGWMAQIRIFTFSEPTPKVYHQNSEMKI